MVLANYPSVVFPVTTFDVTIINGCATGFGCANVAVPNQSATVGQAASTFTFSTSTECGQANFTILESYPWLSISANVAA